jgi:hypothetical protein
MTVPHIYSYFEQEIGYTTETEAQYTLHSTKNKVYAIALNIQLYTTRNVTFHCLKQRVQTSTPCRITYTKLLEPKSMM